MQFYVSVKWLQLNWESTVVVVPSSKEYCTELHCPVGNFYLKGFWIILSAQLNHTLFDQLFDIYNSLLNW